MQKAVWRGTGRAGGRVFCLSAAGTGRALWIEEDGCQAESHPLHWCGYQGSHDRYTVTYTPPHPGLYWYYFSVELADGLHYCARGYGGQAELLEAVGDKYQLTVYDGDYHTPVR